MTLEEKQKRFVKLSWEILRLKYYYYQLNESLVEDHVYDATEREYDTLAKELGLEPSASDMVGWKEDRPCCRLVAERERGNGIRGVKKEETPT